MNETAAAEQSALWNGQAGRAWVDAQNVLDRVLQPFEDLLLAFVAARPYGRVLDIGCGTGSTTVAAALLLGGRGSAIGVDISAPMIAAARARAERAGAAATFVLDNAQTHAFEPGGATTIVSRFGVMFFDDPVRAFANLRRATAAEGAMQFVAWRSAAENPFMTTAERAAAPLLPDLPGRRPGAPGQFAFGDRDGVTTMLEESGWRDVDIRSIDVPCTLPERELVGYFSRLGPVGQALPGLDDRTRAQVIDTVRAAFEPFVHGDEVRFTAACWLVAASAP